jgi:hypothetical protein
MANTPGEHGPIGPLSEEERGARKAFRLIEAEKCDDGSSDCEAGTRKLHERLRAVAAMTVSCLFPSDQRLKRQWNACDFGTCRLRD